MKLRKNIKLIIGIIVGMLLVSGISVYATYKYFATDVIYTKDGTDISVAQALNELYKNKKETTDETLPITTNNKYTLGKYYKNIEVNVPITFGTTHYSNNNSDNVANKSTTLTLSKGKYIINVISAIGSLIDTSFNNSSDITLPLSCSNGTPQKIAGRSYLYTSSGHFNGQHTFDICQLTSYYIEITEDNTTVSYSKSDTANSLISNIIALQAIPIN